MADLNLLRRLPPWSGNLGKHLNKSPKLYSRDSGLVIENLLAAAGNRRTARFYRSAVGAEIDLVREKSGSDHRTLHHSLSFSMPPMMSTLLI